MNSRGVEDSFRINRALVTHREAENAKWLRHGNPDGCIATRCGVTERFRVFIEPLHSNVIVGSFLERQCAFVDQNHIRSPFSLISQSGSSSSDGQQTPLATVRAVTDHPHLMNSNSGGALHFAASALKVDGSLIKIFQLIGRSHQSDGSQDNSTHNYS